MMKKIYTAPLASVIKLQTANAFAISIPTANDILPGETLEGNAKRNNWESWEMGDDDEDDDE